MVRASIIEGDPDLYMVEERPTEEQQAVIDLYADQYEKFFNFVPYGLHYIVDARMFPMTVWFPLSEKEKLLPSISVVA